MSDTLSSMIAFVGFLIVFSMLIQSLQEALKNVFKLKAGVWERFFINLYSVDFQKKSMLKERPFWERVKKGQFVGEFQERLKGLKKVVIAADECFKEIKPLLIEITEPAPEKKRSIEPVKTDAVFEIMGRIKGLKIDTVLRIYNEKKRLEINETASEKLPAGDEGPVKRFTRKLEQLYADFESHRQMPFETVKEKCEDLLELILEFEKDLSTYRVQIENKADAWLVQLEGEYKKNMLKWTLFISIGAVVVLNADTFSIYKYFSVNSQAQKIMIESVTTSISQVNEMRVESLNEINEALKQDEYETAKKGLLDMSAQIEKEFVMMEDKKDAETAKAIIDSASKLTGEPGDIEKLKAMLGQLTGLFLSLQKSSIDYHLASLDATGMPIGWWSYDLQDLQNDYGEVIPGRVLKKIFGLLLTIFLVSFGAPFWKNIMNALINIRNLSKKSSGGRMTA